MRLERDGDPRLAHEIGPGWTKLLAMTGRRIDAETALRIGIVQEVVARNDPIRRGDRIIQTVRGAVAAIGGSLPLTRT
ncbi:MAG: hypothetical protein CL908_08385 [Deltaproteobacteria bacterium]|nr:hypothetical protein [Deltaproteobacteria bacterium]